MHAPAPRLSLVVPVKDGAAFIQDSIETIVGALEGYGQPFELIVVCDGSRDTTVEIANAALHPAVRVFHYPQNQGKGFAISLGLAQARGDLIGWLDADLDIHPEAIVNAARRFDAEAVDAVIGSKRHPDSEVDYPFVRRVYSRGFQALVRLLFRLKVRDTQVGAKVLRREVVDVIGPLLLIKRYAFDVEVLAVGAAFGFDRVVEVPVRLDYRFTGTGIDWTTVFRMLWDTIAVAYRIHLRHWYVRQFAAVQRQRTDARALRTAVRPPAAPQRDGRGDDDADRAEELTRPPATADRA
ncbi:MAG TPA: glycosyltransferase [Solirubrobacteraceae bacterium]